jgi:hypothetical protein
VQAEGLPDPRLGEGSSLRTRYSVLASLLFAVTFALPSFGATDLAWNQPPGFPGAAQGLAFDCSNPDAVHRAVFVFDVPQTVTDVVALEVTFGAAAGGLIVPGTHEPFEPFWHFERAGCNEGAIAVSHQLPADITGIANPWGPHGSQAYASIAGLVYSATDPGVLRLDVRIDRTSPVTIEAGTEYFGGSLEWFMTCAASCRGCDQPVAIALIDVHLVRVGGDFVYAPVSGLGCITANGADCSIVGPQRAFVPGAYLAVPERSAAAVCEPVPVHAPTWGSLKTLYR